MSSVGLCLYKLRAGLRGVEFAEGDIESSSALSASASCHPFTSSLPIHTFWAGGHAFVGDL